MDWLASLNEKGCFAMGANVGAAELALFVQEIDRCTQSWFSSNLVSALGDESVPDFNKKKSPDEEKRASWARGRRQWLLLSEEQRQQVLSGFDLRTEVGARNTFDNQRKRKYLSSFSFLSADCQFYVSERTTFVVQGNSRMALAQITSAWTRSGFGFWAHLQPNLAVKVALSTRLMIRQVGFGAYLKGMPHLIYKPPSGSELKVHHDGINTNNLIRELETYVSEMGPANATTEGWARKKGMQTLVHVEGGYVDGFTYTIGPINPIRLLVCLKAIKEERGNEIQCKDEHVVDSDCQGTRLSIAKEEEGGGGGGRGRG